MHLSRETLPLPARGQAGRRHPDTLASNFSRDNRFRRTGWLCLCGEREEQEHVRLHCNVYKDIREKYDDLTSDDNLVGFYREVLARRDKVREEEEKEEKRRRIGQGAGDEEEE